MIRGSGPDDYDFRHWIENSNIYDAIDLLKAEDGNTGTYVRRAEGCRPVLVPV